MAVAPEVPIHLAGRLYVGCCVLQSEGYARALISARLGKSSSDQVKRLITTRTERLGALAKSDPLLWFVVRQAVFEQPVGGVSVMQQQLSDIVQEVEQERIRVQVLPNNRATVGLCDAFRVMTLSDTQTVAFAEHTVGSTLFDSPERVGELLTLFGFIAAESLSQVESTDFIRKINEENYGHLG